MYQYQQTDHNQQQGTTVMQPAHPFPYAVRSPEARQLKHVGILLFITGAVSIILNVIGLSSRELMSDYGQGFWCGAAVSWPT